MDYTRYAFYFVPEAGSDLAEFGAAWLGWDVVRGQVVPPQEGGLWPRAEAELVTAPAKYGFHGTLKPPFRLAEGQTLDDLVAAAGAFAATRRAIDMPHLELARLGRFLALVPEGDAGDLAAYASDVVEVFEPFRAPMDPAELEKRRARGLSARQDALLLRWGYPYVREEFRFHMTLTGPLDEAVIDGVQAGLRPHLRGLVGRAVPVVDLCLLGERALDGRFEVLRRFPFGGDISQ